MATPEPLLPEITLPASASVVEPNAISGCIDHANSITAIGYRCCSIVIRANVIAFNYVI